MALRYINQKNGAIALPTGLYGAFQSFSAEESQAVEDVTVYGASVYGAFLGSGTPTYTLEATGFIQVGSSTSTPGFGGMTSAGAAATVTHDTGTTNAGTFVAENFRTMHDRRTGAEKGTWRLRNAGDITNTWASS